MLEIIKRTGVFLIIAETIYQFVQENRYARYVRLLIRIMTMALLIIPVLDFIKKGSSDLFYGNLGKFESEYDNLFFVDEESMWYDMEVEESILYDSVTTETGSYIKTICNNCVSENGYEVLIVSVQNESICIGVKRMEGIVEEDIHEEVRELRDIFAECLNISAMNIEVVIYA